MRDIYSRAVGIRNFVRVKMSANLLFNMEKLSVGTAWLMSLVSLNLFHVCDFRTVSKDQHTYSSTAQWLRLPLYTETCYSDVLILWYKNCGTAVHRLVGIERFTNGVWCKAFSVENCNGKTCRPLWHNGIKVDIWQIYLLFYEAVLILLNIITSDSIRTGSAMSGFCE